MKTFKIIIYLLFSIGRYTTSYAQIDSNFKVGAHFTNPIYNNTNQAVIAYSCSSTDSLSHTFDIHFGLENHDSTSIYFLSKTYQVNQYSYFSGTHYLYSFYDTLDFFHPIYMHDFHIIGGPHYKVNQSWKFSHYLVDFEYHLALPYMQTNTGPNGYYQDSISNNWVYGENYGSGCGFAVGEDLTAPYSDPTNMDSVFMYADFVGVEVDFMRYIPEGNSDSAFIGVNYLTPTGLLTPFDYEEIYTYYVPEDSIVHIERLISTDEFGSVHFGGGTYFDNVRLYPVYNQYICQGDSLEINGDYQFTEGVYIDSLFTALGTDSIIGINLKFNEVLYGDTIEAIACEGEGYMINDTTLISNSGVFSFLTITPQGCDSIFYLDLEIQPNDIALDITNTDNVLSYNNPQSDYSYQWINASTGQPISGETNDTFIPTVNGLYAVEISNGVCTQVSNSSTTTLGIHDLGKQITCTPNPFTSSVNILFGDHMESGNIELYDINSRLLITRRFNNTVKTTLNTEFLPAGVYVIKVKTSKGLYQKKVAK